LDRNIPYAGACVTITPAGCSNLGCTASVLVYNQLVEDAFQNVRHYPAGIDDWEDAGIHFDGEGVQRKEYFAARPSAQPFNQQLIQPVGCIQWDPMAGAINLLVAPRTFNVATRYLHAFTIEVMIVG
jgi:hypothetical protein